MFAHLGSSKPIRWLYFLFWLFVQLLLLFSYLPVFWACVMSLCNSLVMVILLVRQSVWEGGFLHINEKEAVVIEDRRGNEYPCERRHVVLSNAWMTVFRFESDDSIVRSDCIITPDMLAYPGYRQLRYAVSALKQKKR